MNKLDNEIINPSHLIHNSTASSILLFAQNTLKLHNQTDPLQIAIMYLGCDYMLSSIREINVVSLMKYKDPINREIISQNHRLQQFIEQNVRIVFENYYKLQSDNWKEKYDKRINDFSPKF
jgi:hypothetical protein